MTFWLAIQFMFWASIVALVYTYLGYPVLLYVISRFRTFTVRRADFQPSVTVVIAAYNEGRDLAAKLKRTLALSYDPALLQIIVASDCSTDSTDEIVRGFAAQGVVLHRQDERLGKTAAQNAAVKLSKGDIILFTDATTLFPSDVLRHILPNFADTKVGCVAGRLVYVDPKNSAVGRGARSYWEYETFLKTLESRVGSLIGVSGCLYAVRRSAYIPLYHEACSDFIIATKVVEQGLRTVYEPNAVSWEETNERPREELKMRVRVITQTYTDLWRHRYMLNPARSGFYSVQLFSHKVLRYLVPVFIFVLFVSTSILASVSFIFAALALIQLLFFFLGIAGWLLAGSGARNRFLAFPHYFLLANFAALIGFYKFLQGERYARWEPIRASTGATDSESSTGNKRLDRAITRRL